MNGEQDSVVSVDVGGDDFGGTMFPGPQDFFRLFLEACDSYSLNTRVVTLLAACLTELSVPRSPAEVRRAACSVASTRLTVQRAIMHRHAASCRAGWRHALRGYGCWASSWATYCSPLSGRPQVTCMPRRFHGRIGGGVVTFVDASLAPLGFVQRILGVANRHPRRRGIG